jgi:hypothetical protein
MKIFSGNYCAQGDLNLFSVSVIPDGLTKLEPHDGQHVLAHSETGHHHVIDGNTVRVYKEDEFVSYLDVEQPSNVVHLRSFDRHETIQLPPGKYRVTRQREYTPEGFRVAQD